MNRSVDLILYNIGQLCTIPSHESGPQRGNRLGDVGIIENAAVSIANGLIVETGSRDNILASFQAIKSIDVQGRLVTPGLIDPHTHLIWAGDRAEEFEQRLNGATYQEIMAAGGGINRTVRDTRAATLLQLVEQGKQRLDLMLKHGTTTVEVKSGYGLNPTAELNILNAIALLEAECAIEVVPTFLGAHAIPPEYASSPEDYVRLLIDEMIPTVAAWRAEHWLGTFYCDAFCEAGAFTLDQTRRILEAAQRTDMKLRLHVDEFTSLGGIALAIEMGAVSADHLLVTTLDDVKRLGRSNTIAILLPATPFGLGIQNTAPAKALINENAIIALATDCNPGTAWCESMQMPLALATRVLGLTQAQALAAATINAAFALDRGDTVGSITAGKQADLVIWDVPDYRQLGYRFGANLVHTVIKKGEVVVENKRALPES